MPLNIHKVAEACHEVNRIYCESIGDLSQQMWERTSEETRDAAIDGVMFAVTRGLADPEDLHNDWMSEKLHDGWKYGEIKDEAAKVHPSLIPYKELPVAQRAKGVLFRKVVEAFIVAQQMANQETK